LIFCGSCDEDATESIIQILMEKASGGEEDKNNSIEHSFSRIFALGLGLLYLGQ